LNLRAFSGIAVVPLVSNNVPIERTSCTPGALNTAPAGRRNLDSFLHPMFVARERGTRFDQATWEAMLRGELGPQAVREFHDELIEGARTVFVASQAFGPCFRRQAVPMKTGEQTVRGFQWTRMPDVPEARCRNW
jgi:hypothetical protein